MNRFSDHPGNASSRRATARATKTMVRWVAQRPLDSGVAILVVDPPLAAGAGRAGVGRGGQDLPILGHLTGVVGEPLVHHVGDLGDAGAEDVGSNSTRALAPRSAARAQAAASCWRKAGSV